MVKNDLLRRSLVLFCAGTAILLLLVQWRTAASTTTNVVANVPNSSRVKPRPLISPPPARGPRLVVDLSDRRVYLYQTDRLQASYPIAVGKPGWETPIGIYQVMEKQKYPVWRHPITDEIVPQGRENPLGSRWIGFWYDGRHLIGFHGTPEAHLIGQPVSHGCLRMRNADIQALYEQISLGTPVVVND
jgi:L,D-transpeptidase ErfK/SrfK